MRYAEAVVDEADRGEEDGAGGDFVEAAGQKLEDWMDDEAGGETVGDVEAEGDHDQGDEGGDCFGEIVPFDLANRTKHHRPHGDEGRAVCVTEMLEWLDERDNEKGGGIPPRISVRNVVLCSASRK